MPKTNPNGHTEWDGDPIGLPDQDEWFIYRGSLYYWLPCNCSNAECKRPLIFNALGEEDMGLTIKARGADLGLPQLDILAKIGYTSDEIIIALSEADDKMEKIMDMIKAKFFEDPARIGPMLQKFANEMIIAIVAQMGQKAKYAGMGFVPRRGSADDFRFGTN